MQAPKGPGFLPSRAFVQGIATRMPQGVDLNLDSFNLSATTQAALPSASASPFEPGKAFFSVLDARPAASAALLRQLFGACVCDRRDEGDSFVPPESSPAYLDHLRKLLQVEKEVSEARLELFRSPSFAAESAGELFPSSWTPAVRTPSAQASLLRSLPPGSALPRPERLLRATAPLLDRQTEDGLRFRVYRAGSLEVRTVQQPGGEETLEAIFAVAPASSSTSSASLPEASAIGAARVAKVLELVESDERETAQTAGLVRARPHRFFLKVETEAGPAALVEQSLPFAWLSPAPRGLEERCSLAKVTRSADCRGSDLTVADIKRFHNEVSQESAACWSDYSRELFERVRAECPPAHASSEEEAA